MLAQGLLGEVVARGLPETTGSRRTACVGGGRGEQVEVSLRVVWKGGGGVRKGQSRSGEGRGHTQESHQQPSQWQEDISGADGDLLRVAKGTRGPSLELWMPRSQGKQSWTHNLGDSGQLEGRGRPGPRSEHPEFWGRAGTGTSPQISGQGQTSRPGFGNHENWGLTGVASSSSLAAPSRRAWAGEEGQTD